MFSKVLPNINQKSLLSLFNCIPSVAFSTMNQSDPVYYNMIANVISFVCGVLFMEMNN